MIKRLIKKRVSSVGLPPGTLIHVGDKKVERVDIHVIDYDENKVDEMHFSDPDDLSDIIRNNHVSWININGLHNMDVIEKIGNKFNIHPLVLEDILNTEHRPKFEDYENYLFIILKMLSYDETNQEVITEQVSIFLTSGSVITFQEREGDVFEGIRARIFQAKGRLRKMGVDFLTYALIDAIIEQFYLILEKVELRLESIEEELIKNPTSETLQEIHRLRRDVLYLRNTAWPLREITNEFIRDDLPFVQESTKMYLRDVYDHTIQILEILDTIRDMISGMLETYLSGVGNRTNEVMKVLTIIATIFIPLTFLAGIYGMNFHYMPELDWKLGYPVVWFIMIVISLVMICFFKRRKWL
ncbi:magnesium/cobalt transporter CorA [candidate division KSB1 bacterium]|nr:magnesium/cobalt transporter CorA [candidate division KSB1 bacterium]